MRRLLTALCAFAAAGCGLVTESRTNPFDVGSMTTSLTITAGEGRLDVTSKVGTFASNEGAGAAKVRLYRTVEAVACDAAREKLAPCGGQTVVTEANLTDKADGKFTDSGALPGGVRKVTWVRILRNQLKTSTLGQKIMRASPLLGYLCGCDTNRPRRARTWERTRQPRRSTSFRPQGRRSN